MITVIFFKHGIGDMTRQLTPDRIASLLAHQIFVFGSNASGFHGAGAAGLAFRGNPDLNWRNDPKMLDAMNSSPGSDTRIGKWAVFGVARGFMQGREGWSYAIETVRSPGLKRSTSISVIKEQLRALCHVAAARLDLEFLVTKIGCGLAGYRTYEIAEIWRQLDHEEHLTDNIILPIEFEFRA